MDKGALYTDGQYLTKDEISSRFNLEDIEGIWQKVVSYREIFRVDIPYKTSQGLSLYYVLTRPLLVRLSNDERKLYQLAIRLTAIRGEAYQHLKKRLTEKRVMKLADFFSVSITEDEAKKIAAGEEVKGMDTGILLNFVNTQESLSKSFMGNFNPSLAYRINADLQGMGTSQDQPSDTTKIAPLFNAIENPDELPLLARTVFIFYWFLTQQPFEYSSNLTGEFLAKSFLAKEGLMRLPFLLDLENLIIDIGTVGEKAIKNSFATRDITYFLTYVLPHFEQAISDLESEIFKAEKESIELDFSTPLNSAKNPKPNDEGTANENGEEAKKADALEEKMITELLETYPVLKSQQAHFLIHHRSTGKYYMVEQYKREEDVVYETARTSMELFARLGFYTKSKSGKRHLFSPVPEKFAPLVKIEKDSAKEEE